MKKLLSIALATACLAAPAHAQVIEFEGLPNVAPIGIFYNGGSGPNVGVSFFGDAYSVNSQVGGCGGSGFFALQPSGCGAMIFLGGPLSRGLNKASGFTTGFSLSYAAAFSASPGSLEVFDGLNGTGAFLGSVALPGTANGGGNPACSGQAYCPWSTVGLTFAGTAMSIRFNGVNDMFFDDINLGVGPAESTVPEPSALVLMAAGLAGLGVFARRRERTQV